MNLWSGVLFLVSVALVGFCITGAATAQTTQSGVIIPVSESQASDDRASLETVFEQLGRDVPTNIGRFVRPNGDQYIIVSDAPIRTGSADIRGEIIVKADANRAGIVYASSISYSDPFPTSFNQLNTIPNKFQWQYIKFSGSVRQVPYTIDVGNQFVNQRSVAVVSNQSLPELSNVGRFARQRTIDFSQNRSLAITKTTAIVSLGRDYYLGETVRGVEWFTNTRGSTHTVSTLSPPLLGGYVRDVEPSSTEITSLSDLPNHRGEVVTLRTGAVGVRLSVQETMLSSARCAPSSITVPGLGCIPIPADMVIHTGVLSASEVSSPVFYAGITNTKQQSATVPERGHYRITGRVMAANELDPRLNGTVILIYDRQKIGSNEESVAGGGLDRIKSLLRDQITSSESEWKETVQAARQTPTPTSTEPSQVAPETSSSQPTDTQTRSSNFASVTPSNRQDEQEKIDSEPPNTVGRTSTGSSEAVQMLVIPFLLMCMTGLVVLGWIVVLAKFDGSDDGS